MVSDLDYKIALPEKTLIPNPVNTDKIAFEPITVSEKVIVFLGKNNSSAIKKGTVFFEEAVSIIQKKYEFKVRSNKSYDTCRIGCHRSGP